MGGAERYPSLQQDSSHPENALARQFTLAVLESDHRSLFGTRQEGNSIRRSSAMGNWRMRIPVACQTALATAPAVPVIPISPTPLMPSALTYGSFSSTRMASIEGTSAFTGTWYSPRFGFITLPERGSMTACSCKANDTPQIMPP